MKPLPARRSQLRERSGRATSIATLVLTLLCLSASLLSQTAPLPAGQRTIPIAHQYLNVPIGRQAKMRVFSISVNGTQRRQFAAQLADDSVDYWIFIDVTEFKGQAITLTGPAAQASLDRIYQSPTIEGAATLYKETGRPLFHFTAKRGWNNDVNGPIFYKGQYHLYWQAFPFGTEWNTDFMYWGHAVSKDLIHWRELPAALMPDKLGAVWSGTSLIDHNNDGGWGKDALVIFYTAFDPASHKQVQCIAYSTDNGVTFKRYAANPVVDSNQDVGSKDTRDPKVFWYAPAHHWVMVLFEKDGLSFYSSTDLRTWSKKSHFKGLYECPDFFELPVEGDPQTRKWILHGGSSTYYIGSFDGETFTAESAALHYAEGKNQHGDDTLYAAQSFEEMPGGRRIQMAWGRITLEGMAFNQMILFPTTFHLKNTAQGLRLQATPIHEIDQLHAKGQTWSAPAITDANHHLQQAGAGSFDIKLQVALTPSDDLTLKLGETTLATIHAADFEKGSGPVEVLIDRGIAEIFIDEGARYIATEIPTLAGATLQLSAAQKTKLESLEIYPMKSMWSTKK